MRKYLESDFRRPTAVSRGAVGQLVGEPTLRDRARHSAKPSLTEFSCLSGAARWRDSLPRRRFERNRMGSRRAAAIRPVEQYRNGEEPGHS
jgi:hypothetical protein